jgi:hypothetical protein
MTVHWQLITGEYPREPGGVSDYTRLVARGLVEAGDDVDVWAPPCAKPGPSDAGVNVHRLRGRFDPRSLAVLSTAARSERLPIPSTVPAVLEYVSSEGSSRARERGVSG